MKVVDRTALGIRRSIMKNICGVADDGPVHLGAAGDPPERKNNRSLRAHYDHVVYQQVLGYDMFTLEPGRERAFISTYQSLDT